MARITSLSGRGFMGRDFHHDLGHKTLVTGPHGSGKTTAADALRFAAQGCLPAIGRTNQLTARAMRGRDLEIVAALDDGRRFSRGLRTHRSSVQGDAAASWIPPSSNVTEHGEAILGLFGRDAREVEENLDLRSLLNASPNARAKRLEEILDSSGVTHATMVQWLEALTYARLAGREADDVWLSGALPSLVESFRGAVTPDQDAAARARVRAVADDLSKDGLAAAMDRVAAQRGDIEAGLRRRMAARAELEDRINAMDDVSDTIDSLEAQRRVLTDAAARQAERAAARARRARDLEAAQRGLREARDAHAALPGIRAAIERDTEDLQAVRATMPPDPGDLDLPAFEPSAEASAAYHVEVGLRASLPPVPDDDAHAAATQALRDAESVQRAAERVAERATDEVRRARISPWVKVVRICESRTSAEARESHDALFEILTIAQANAPDVLDLEARAEAAADDVKQAAKAREAAQERQDAAIEAHRVAVEVRKRSLRDLEAAQKAFSDLSKRDRDAYDVEVRAMTADHNARSKAYRDASQRIADLQRALDDRTRSAERVEADLRAAERRVADLSGHDEEPSDALSAEDLQARVEALTEKIAAAQRADARQSEMAAIVAEIIQAEAALDAARAAEWALQRIRERDMGERGEPILRVMRRFLAAAGHDEEPYFEAVDRQVDFGWVRGDRKIHVSTMGGAEAVLYTCALAAAITSLRAPEVRVLLVEASEAGGVMQNLLAGLDAISDCLDNVIVCTWVPIEAPDGWTDIRLAQHEEAAS